MIFPVNSEYSYFCKSLSEPQIYAINLIALIF